MKDPYRQVQPYTKKIFLSEAKTRCPVCWGEARWYMSVPYDDGSYESYYGCANCYNDVTKYTIDALGYVTDWKKEYPNGTKFSVKEDRMKDKFKYAQVGDTVFSVRLGWGKITQFHEGSIHCMEVYFEEHGPITYTRSGKYNMHDQYPELHWDEPWCQCFTNIAIIDRWGQQKFDKPPKDRREPPKPELVVITGEGGKSIEISRKSAEEMGLA